MIGERLRRIPSWQLTLGAALLGLGFLIAAQLASEGPRVRYTTQERSPLLETATELQDQQEVLKTRILDLRARSARPRAPARARPPRWSAQRYLQEARIAAGLIPLTGTGVVLQLEDSTEPVAPDANESDYLVTARDLRTVIADLWTAGAEAISVNGERVTATTSLIDIGGSVLVNSAYLAPPYQVTAIGPGDVYDRLIAAPAFVDFVRARAQGFGIRLSFAEPPRGGRARLRRDDLAALLATGAVGIAATHRRCPVAVRRAAG